MAGHAGGRHARGGALGAARVGLHGHDPARPACSHRGPLEQHRLGAAPGADLEHALPRRGRARERHLLRREVARQHVDALHQPGRHERRRAAEREGPRHRTRRGRAAGPLEQRGNLVGRVAHAVGGHPGSGRLERRERPRGGTSRTRRLEHADAQPFRQRANEGQVGGIKRTRLHTAARLGERGHVPLGNAVQDGVGKARRPRGHAAHELHPLAHADVLATPEVEQLEAGQAQRVAHARLQAGAAAQVRAYRAVEGALGGRDPHDEAHGEAAVALGEGVRRLGAAQQVARPGPAAPALAQKRERHPARLSRARH